MEVVASLSQGRTAAAQCGLFTYRSVPIIFEPPCTKFTVHAMKDGMSYSTIHGLARSDNIVTGLFLAAKRMKCLVRASSIPKYITFTKLSRKNPKEHGGNDGNVVVTCSFVSSLSV